jgi:hypothetical protein
VVRDAEIAYESPCTGQKETEPTGQAPRRSLSLRNPDSSPLRRVRSSVTRISDPQALQTGPLGLSFAITALTMAASAAAKRLTPERLCGVSFTLLKDFLPAQAAVGTRGAAMEKPNGAGLHLLLEGYGVVN